MGEEEDVDEDASQLSQQNGLFARSLRLAYTAPFPPNHLEIDNCKRVNGPAAAE